MMRRKYGGVVAVATTIRLYVDTHSSICVVAKNKIFLTININSSHWTLSVVFERTRPPLRRYGHSRVVVFNNQSNIFENRLYIFFNISKENNLLDFRCAYFVYFSFLQYKLVQLPTGHNHSILSKWRYRYCR